MENPLKSPHLPPEQTLPDDLELRNNCNPAVLAGLNPTTFGDLKPGQAPETLQRQDSPASLLTLEHPHCPLH